MSGRRRSLLLLALLLPAGRAAGQMTSLDELDRHFTRIVDDVAPPVSIADCSLRGALTRAGADIEGARERAAARSG